MKGGDASRASATAVNEPAMAILEVAGAERLRDQGVEPEQQPHREDRHADEQRAADADCADRFRAEPPHHQRVDHPHRHPAELRHHDRRGEPEHRAEFRSETAEHRDRDSRSVLEFAGSSEVRRFNSNLEP